MQYIIPSNINSGKIKCMTNIIYEHPRKYALRDCSSLYPCIYLVFWFVGAPSIGKERVSLKEMPHFFFYTEHAAKPYILAIQKLNDLMRREGHHAFINLKNSKQFAGIFYQQIFDSWGTPLGKKINHSRDTRFIVVRPRETSKSLTSSCYSCILVFL
jgi:hypothetical protein